MNEAGSITRVDVGLISDEPLLIEFCQTICGEYGYSMKHWSELEPFMDERGDYRFVLASLKNFESKEAAAELAQGIRFVSQDAFVVCATSGTLAKESAQFARKSGANLVLLKEELLATSKLEFAMVQAVKSSHLPIKATDLVPGQAIPFDIFHLLTQRGKFLKFLFAGDVMDDKKYQKCKEVGEVYIHRNDTRKFEQFVLGRRDSSSDGLARRCRSQYLCLYASYSELLVQLTDQTANVSLGEGQALLKACTELCARLLGVLAEFGDAWKVINNSAIGELGSVERAPAIAAYVGIFGLQAGLEHVEQAMLAALLVDLGLILLPPGVLKKIRDDRLDLLTAPERLLYENHPNLSLDVVLGRKLSVDGKMRSLMLSTHERADGTGFPGKLPAEKIPLAAQLIKYCRVFDRRTQLRMGRARTDRDAVRKEMFAEDGTVFLQYTEPFWALIKQATEA